MSGDGSAGPVWDDVVDVICVGASPGVLAYAICCAAADLDVLLVRPRRQSDDIASEWAAAMTADLDVPASVAEHPTPHEGSGLLLPREEPVGQLAPFCGESLREFSSGCLGSPFGVMFTQIPRVLAPMRNGEGEAVTAALMGRIHCGDRPGSQLQAWLADHADDTFGEEVSTIGRVVDVDGRPEGVELDSGERIGAAMGLAFPVGPVVTDWPRQPEFEGRHLVVALVGRPVGRFARVELRGDDDGRAARLDEVG